MSDHHVKPKSYSKLEMSRHTDAIYHILLEMETGERPSLRRELAEAQAQAGAMREAMGEEWVEVTGRGFAMSGTVFVCPECRTTKVRNKHQPNCTRARFFDLTPTAGREWVEAVTSAREALEQLMKAYDMEWGTEDSETYQMGRDALARIAALGSGGER